VWNGPEKTLGCSPDGLIAGTKEAIEIKAPATHIEMIRVAYMEALRYAWELLPSAPELALGRTK
jgi:hypothetical protein